MEMQEAQKEQCWRTHSFPILKLTTKLQLSRLLYWHNGRHIDQRKGLESPKIITYTYGQLNLNNGTSTTQQGKNSLSNKWYWN